MKNKNIGLIFAVCGALAACSSQPSHNDPPRAEGTARQAAFYQEEAEAWRTAGNRGMAEYFDHKAQKTRGIREGDDTLLDLVIDILFE